MKNGESILPPLYLQSYFRQLKNGMSIKEIVEEIYFIYKNSHDNIINFLNGAEDFAYLKGKIVYRLIRRLGNEVFLSDVPFTPYVDLAVVYYLLLEVNKFGQITALIRNEHLILWNIKLETLHRAAEVNTAKMLPVSFRPIWDIVSEIFDSNTKHENESATLREDEETINPPLFASVFKNLCRTDSSAKADMADEELQHRRC